MPDNDYDDIIAAATGPTRTRKGALKYQPPDADWNLDRLIELQDFYQGQFGRPLPLSVKGQGSVHNRLGYDHRASADIGIHPSSKEGQALIAEMQRANIPFLAFEGAIPGASTGPHIHVGRPSSRVSTKYNVGSQVKRPKRQSADDYSDIITAATSDTASSADYTDVIEKAAPPQRKLSPADFPAELIKPGWEGTSNLADIRRLDEQRQREARDTGMGRLKTIDEPQLQRVQAIQRQTETQRQQRAARRSTGSEAQLMAQVAQPSFAEEFTANLQANANAEAERQRILSSFTDADRQQLAQLTEQLRGHGSVGRGVDIGVQRLSSGLMYKLAGLADLTVHDRAMKSFPLGDYLRRQAGIGDIAIEDIQAELPPDTRQQVADFLTTSIGALPEIYAATAIGGPVAGFAALGGLEAAGRKRPLVEIARETAKGAVIGGVFKAAPTVESGLSTTFRQRAADVARSGLAIGTGTVAVEKAFGADDAAALQAAATNILFHAGGKASAEIGRFAQAAERVLKTPDAVPEPTVPLETQARLSAAEEARLKAEPLAPSVPMPTERRGPDRIRDADWLEMSPEERARIRGELAAEMEPPPTERPVIAEQPSLPFAEPVVRSPLAELMRQRAEAEPSIAETVTELPPLNRVEHDKSRAGGVRMYLGEGEHIPLKEVHRMLDLPEGVIPDIARASDKVGGESEVTIRLSKEGRRAIEEEQALAQRLSGLVTETPAPTPTEAGPVTAEPASRLAREAEARFRELLDMSTEQIKKEFGERSDYPGSEDPFGVHENQATNAIADYAKATGITWDQAAIELRARTMRITPEQAAKELGIEPAKPTRPPKDQGGYVDLNEIREGLRAGRIKIEEAVERLRKEFGGQFGGRLDEEHFRSLAYRKDDPLLGVEEGGQVRSSPSLFRGEEHYDVFGFGIPADTRWRYEPITQKVYWSDSVLSAPKESQRAVEQHLAQKGYEVKGHDILAEWYKVAPELKRREAQPPVHHAAQQPRTPTGQFTPGEPGSPAAERQMLKREAVKYREEFKAVDRHLARREGLDIVNDDVAANYFRRLRNLVRVHQPERTEAVDRAEALFNQGKYGQATMLAESVFRGLPDKVNEYSSAMAASKLVEMGQETRADMWTRTIAEVKRRIREETGPPISGGSAIYDVNKYPKGGLPDHQKIAYILEPVVDALRSDIRFAIEKGKLTASDYVAEVRRQVDRMLAGSDFSDWHGINKSAARGILVDRLKREGFEAVKGGDPTIPVEPPQPSAPEPRERKRSLPKTLERSGRDPGTNLTYTEVPNLPTEARVTERIAKEGVDAVETWYRSADAPSAERSAAFVQLVDHYTAESVKLADTAPQAAQVMRAKAVELTNLEAERATSIGQAEQFYSRINKYNPVGVIREIASLKSKGFSVPDKAAEQLVRAATEHQKLDKEVGRLERKVATTEVAEGEAAPPQGGGGPSKPRRYTPRKSRDTLSISAAERAREQLSEAAKRRRAAKRAIANQLRQIEQQRTALGYWKRSMNITRGLMVSQLATAIRNWQSQAVRFDVERLTDAVELSLRKSVGLSSDLTYRNIWRNTARQFKTTQTAEAKELLSAHPTEFARMFNAYAGGVEVPIPAPAHRALERVFQKAERAVEIANTVNRLQEFHVRSAEFLAEVDLHLRKEQNQSLEKFVERNGIDAIPQDIITKGVNKALEVTFSDMPSKDGAGGRLINSLVEIGNHIPPTVSPVAFPRFMYNNLKFLYQYNPTGLVDVAVSAARNRSIAKQIETTRTNTELTETQRTAKLTELEARRSNIARAVGRTLIGSSMLLLAYQFRQSDHAGEKWYELKIGDTTLDARPFGPFSTYLFFAEAIHRQRTGTKQFTIDEVAQALGSSPLGTGAGIALIEKVYKQITDADWDGLQKTLKAEAGEWGRALLTPIRQVKDLIAAFDESQAITRETSSEPFLGPIRESIPYASTDLPPAQRPTTATPIQQVNPLTKQLTGWRMVQPKTFLERQLDELNFSSSEVRTNTGIPELDALEKKAMGERMDELSTQLENDEEFKSLSPKARAKYLKDFIGDIREEVRETTEAEHPELYEQLREKRTPRREREFQKELEGSPGLSKALRLGVPMSIPPMQPNEDDIAYRARLLQLGRQRRGRLDGALTDDFDILSRTEQRMRLRDSVYS